VNDPISLAAAPCSTPLKLVACLADPALRNRLGLLGLRLGAELEAMHPTPGGGRVIAVAGSRLALDRFVVNSLQVVVA